MEREMETMKFEHPNIEYFAGKNKKNPKFSAFFYHLC